MVINALLVTKQDYEKTIKKVSEKYGENIDIIYHYYTFSNADTLYKMYTDLERNKMFVTIDIPLKIVNNLIVKGVDISYID